MSDAARQVVEFVTSRMSSMSGTDLVRVALELHKLLIDEYRRRKLS